MASILARLGATLRFWRMRLLWLLIALLAAFVLFIEVLADVGGDAPPVDRPEQRDTPTPTILPPASTPESVE
jgi:hypothetical protein